MPFTLAKLAEYGILGVIIAIMFFILWRMIIWVMAFVKEQAAMHAKERASWEAVLGAMKSSIDTHNAGSIEARKSQAEASRFVRTEHKEMINNLKEQGEVLKMINGYKKES